MRRSRESAPSCRRRIPSEACCSTPRATRVCSRVRFPLFFCPHPFPFYPLLAPFLPAPLLFTKKKKKESGDDSIRHPLAVHRCPPGHNCAIARVSTHIALVSSHPIAQVTPRPMCGRSARSQSSWTSKHPARFPNIDLFPFFFVPAKSLRLLFSFRSQENASGAQWVKSRRFRQQISSLSSTSHVTRRTHAYARSPQPPPARHVIFPRVSSSLHPLLHRFRLRLACA